MYKICIVFHTDSPNIFENNLDCQKFNFLKGKFLSFESLKKDSLDQINEFAITVGKFEDKDEAQKESHILKDCLLMLGAKWRIGVKVSKVDVVATDAIVLNVGFKSATYLASRSIEIFRDELDSIMNLNPKLSDKQRLALELYGNSYYEYSVRAQFLTLITAIESLIKKKKLSKNISDVIDQLKQFVMNSDTISDIEKKSISERLSQELKKQTITEAVAELVKTHLDGKEYAYLTEKGISYPSEFVTSCYKVRNKLVHNGSSDEHPFPSGIKNFEELTRLLKLVVADLLLKIIES
ncbi:MULTISPECIES: HEPN domain-containing protein [Pseudanabaena]|jgi:hypothetical protein|uniref:HEPN domain-containing protein n=1 Tax=Pseudanabaena TaxID=1152 RepID=UPI0024799B0C|nr:MULTISPECIES: HEPN domain-containing protein [Pseudanabaena]MEA5488539.1 HEPN domain-containing protein [Pseudanabaena sp. CCNP1317]WGS71939.1 HEPN domain-containing protein [Pseudanabaena galeata CCNP1313]